MPKSEALDLEGGLVIHNIEPASDRMTRWKKEIGEMTEVELVLAAVLIKVRAEELRKTKG